MRSVHIFFGTLMVSHGSDTLINACNGIQQGIFFMVLNSESSALKHVSSPSRDRKYVLVAYARLMSEYATQMTAENLTALTSGILELASQSTGESFVTAGVVERNAEDLLVDGAVDQTFAFNRQ